MMITVLIRTEGYLFLGIKKFNNFSEGKQGGWIIQQDKARQA
jgi:hypothetical protein